MRKFFDEEQKELFSSCNVPWTLSLTNTSVEKAIEQTPCNSEIGIAQTLSLEKFFYSAQKWVIPECKGNADFTSSMNQHYNIFSVERLYLLELHIRFISAPCYTSTYKTKITSSTYQSNGDLARAVTDLYRKRVGIKGVNSTESYVIVLNYENSDVVISEELQLYTLPDFISSIGGNLGLFVGFSCLPVLLYVAEIFCNLRTIRFSNCIGPK